MVLSVYCCPHCSNDRYCVCVRVCVAHREMMPWEEIFIVMDINDESTEEETRHSRKWRKSVCSWLLNKLPPSSVTPLHCSTPCRSWARCSLFHIPSAASEEMSHLNQSVPVQPSTGTRWQQLFPHMFNMRGFDSGSVALIDLSARRDPQASVEDWGLLVEMFLHSEMLIRKRKDQIVESHNALGTIVVRYYCFSCCIVTLV